MHERFFHSTWHFSSEILLYNEKLIFLKMNLREHKYEDIFLLQTDLFVN